MTGLVFLPFMLWPIEGEGKQTQRTRQDSELLIL